MCARSVQISTFTVIAHETHSHRYNQKDLQCFVMLNVIVNVVGGLNCANKDNAKKRWDFFAFFVKLKNYEMSVFV